MKQKINLKPDCGWLAPSGKDYQELLAKGKYGFYVRTPDKKRTIIEIEKEKLTSELKTENGRRFLIDYFVKEIETLLAQKY